MAFFWKYFRETLKFPLISKDGPLAQLAQGGAEVLDDVREVIIWLRDQFNPETCDADMLDGFAASRGITRHGMESVDVFRDRVAAAYAWHLLGGSVGGLETILAHYGFPDADIVNLRDEDESRWAEFRVEFNDPGLSYGDDGLELLGWVINDQKPARSMLSEVRINQPVELPVFFGGGVICRTKAVYGPYFPAMVLEDNTQQFFGGGVVQRGAVIIN